jgi:hypothetical protein
MATQRFGLSYGSVDVDDADGIRSVGSTVLTRTYRADYDSGTDDSQIEAAFSDVQTLMNASVDYDLSALPGGKSFSRIKGWTLEVLSPVGTVGYGSVGPGSSHGWFAGMGGAFPINPMSVLSGQWPEDAYSPVVTPGSNERITVTVVGTLQYLLTITGNL